MPTRRHFLRTGLGLGSIALGDLLAGRPQPHFRPTAKNVIFLLMPGGPSQIDLFDPKPALRQWHGKPLPASLTQNLRLAFIKPNANAVASPRTFTPHPATGMEISDLLPHLARRSEDICLIRSLRTDAFNHDPGELVLMTGTTQPGRPSMGAWALYGLSSESENLPGFVVLSSGTPPSAGANNWGTGFLPSIYQGTPFRNTGDPILHLKSPTGYSAEKQRARLDTLRALNELHKKETLDPEIEARIASYELAFRMQSAAPELIDFSKESKQTLEMYGVGSEPMHPYAVNCLLARRMVERGVRFVLITHGSWDDHNDIDQSLAKNCRITDQPAAALLTDLKQRGLLDSTLVIWGGEFGRTPMTQQQRTDIGYGRDHHPNCFSMWLAGGGVKRGVVVGKTDEFGLQGIEDSHHVHDLQATILHCLGMDHLKLTYHHMGRDFRLTDTEGAVIKKVLA